MWWRDLDRWALSPFAPPPAGRRHIHGGALPQRAPRALHVDGGANPQQPSVSPGLRLLPAPPIILEQRARAIQGAAVVARVVCESQRRAVRKAVGGDEIPAAEGHRIHVQVL